jgi:type I restriction enzyme S subunit
MKASGIELGKCVTQYRNEIWVDDTEIYGQITVSSTGKVSLRGTKRGSEIGRKRQFVLDLKTNPNTLTFTRQGVYDGAIGFAPPNTDGCIATENMPMFSLNEGLNRSYFEQLFLSPVFKNEINKLAPKGAAQKSIHERILLKVSIPLPSPETQAKIATLLHERRQVIDDVEHEITHQQTLLGKLKQAILQEAIQGKLTADWRAANPDVEPASELLQRIQAEKARLIAEKKIRKEKPLPEITPEEIPFEIPDGWEWCRFGEVIRLMNGASFASGDFHKGDGVKCIKITNTGVGQFVETDDTLPSNFSESYSNYQVFTGDMILALTRPYIADGLKISRCPESYNGALLNQRVAAIRSIDGGINPDFAFLFLGSDFVLRDYQAEFESKGQQPNLKSSHVTHLRFPLPPLAEQAAIVERVEALIATCRELETEIERSRTHAADLLQAVLKEAFAPAS